MRRASAGWSAAFILATGVFSTGVATPSVAQSVVPPIINSHNVPSQPGPTNLSLKQMVAKGSQLLQEHKPLDAENVFYDASLRYPGNFSLEITVASLALENGHYTRAVEAANGAVTIDEESEPAYDLRAGAYAELKDYNRAFADIETAISLAPNLPRLYKQAGDMAINAKHYRAAIKNYNLALGFHPEDPQVHIALGDAYEQANLHAQAVNEYRSGIYILDQSKPAPASPDGKILQQAELSCAVSLAGLKDYTSALNIAREQLTLDPKSETTLSTVAQIEDMAGEHSAAVQLYLKALSIQPKDAIVWGNLGWAQYEEGQYAAALGSSNRALFIDDSLKYVQYNKGLVYAVQGDSHDALETYRLAIANSVAADIESGLDDVRNAIKKHGSSPVLKQALALLNSARDKALGLPD